MIYKFYLFQFATSILCSALSLAIDSQSAIESPALISQQDLEWIISNPARRSQYISDRLTPQEFLALIEKKEQEITNGPVIGVLISSVFTGFTGGIVAGALALFSGLLQIILSPQPQEPPRRAEDPNYAPQFGSNEGTGGVVKLGQPISAIFCSRSLDPTGGYTTGGSLINARIETIDGSQVAYLLYSIGHGEIGQVDLDKTLLNQQPVRLPDPSLRMGWKPGRSDDQPLADFADLSQNVVARINQYSGVNLISESTAVGAPINVTNVAAFQIGYTYVADNPNSGFQFTVIEVDNAAGQITTNKSLAGFGAGTAIYQWLPGNAYVGSITSMASSTTSDSFYVTTGEIDSYSLGSTYLYEWPSQTGEFRVLSRNLISAPGQPPLWRVDTDRRIPEGSGRIFTLSRVKYRSTRRVNQLDLNFVMKVWGRDSIGSLVDFAQSYLLRIRQYNQSDFTTICRFYVRSFNVKDIFRAIEIKNLSLYTYDVEIVPESRSVDDNLPLIELKDSGSYTEAIYQGYTIRYQGVASTLTIADLNALTSQARTRVPQHSGQGNATLQLLHANEREYISSTPRLKNLGYPGLACIWVVKRFTIDTSGQLQFQFFVPEGIIVDSLLAAGVASAASTPSTLRQLNHGLVMAPGLKLRNVDKGISADIIAVLPNDIATNAPLNWEQDDRWYAYGRRSSCWWPEIKAWLLKDPRFSASNSITADFDLNYPSLVAAVKYCSGRNEFNQSFAWHGVLPRSQKVAELDAQNCAKVNLFPIDIDGGKGYWPMQSPEVVGQFNVSNAKDFRITRLPELEIDPPTSCTITYKEQQQAWIADDSLRFLDLSVTASVKNVPLTKELSFAIPECTSRSQAIVTSRIRLNYGRYFGRSQASLNAKQIEAVSLELGGLIRVQLQTMNYDAEQSGIVIQTDSLGRFRLDNEFTMVRSLSTSANAFGLSDQSINFIDAGVVTGDLVRNEESGQVSVILGVASRSITCTPAIPVDTYYQIANLTTGDVLIWRGSADRLLPPTTFLAEYINDHIWYTIPAGIPIEVGEVVQIGSNLIQERFFQVLSIGYQIPQSDDKEEVEMSIPVTGAGWDSRMFNFSDLEVSTIDDVI